MLELAFFYLFFVSVVTYSYQVKIQNTLLLSETLREQRRYRQENKPAYYVQKLNLSPVSQFFSLAMPILSICHEEM